MSGSPSYIQRLTSQRSAGTLISNTAAATSIINVDDPIAFSPNWLFPGAEFTVECDGAISVVTAAQPTFTFNFMLGNIAVWSSGALGTLVTAAVLLPFKMKLDLRLDSIGTGTSAKFIGTANFSCAAMSVANGVVPVTSPVVGTGFNSQISNLSDFQITMSAANAATGIRVDNYKLFQHCFGG